jgi:hypothetical protein
MRFLQTDRHFSMLVGKPDAVWAGHAVILSIYGGGFATNGAYLRDLLGTMQVGDVHGASSPPGPPGIRQTVVKSLSVFR